VYSVVKIPSELFFPLLTFFSFRLVHSNRGQPFINTGQVLINAGPQLISAGETLIKLGEVQRKAGEVLIKANFTYIPGMCRCFVVIATESPDTFIRESG
jgi:hypothetical protein